MDNLKADTIEDEVRGIAQKIAPYLDQHHPSVQGLVLAELVWIWVNGHDPVVGLEVWEMS